MLLLFLLSVALMLLASEALTRGLENIGARLGLSEGLIGLVTALGADAPEISSACSAVFSRHHDLGLGIVLGSNVFNLAGLLGLSAVVAGQVRIGRHGLLLNGGTGLLVIVVVALLMFGWIPAWLCFVLLASILGPYVVLLALPPVRVGRLWLPAPVTRFLETAVGHAHRAVRSRRARPGGTRDVVIVVASLALVVAAGIGAVRSATALAVRWHLPHAVMGTVILAALTSLPNVVAAVRLAREGRGAAVVSESLNSNSLNVLAGIGVPALFLGLGAVSDRMRLTTAWLLGMTVVALVAASHRQGLRRGGGTVLIALYVIFVVGMVLGVGN